jgi:hypothetical protein
VKVAFCLTLSTIAAVVGFSCFGHLPLEAVLPSLCTLSIAFVYASIVGRDKEFADREMREGGFLGHAVNVQLFFVMTVSRDESETASRPSKSGLLEYASPLASRDIIVGFLALIFVGITYVLAVRLHERGTEAKKLFRELDTAISVTESSMASSGAMPVFVVSGAEQPFQWISPLSGARRMAEIRIIKLGWTARSPHYKTLLRHLSVDDLNRALYEQPNFCLVCSNDSIPVIIEYMKQRHQIDVVPQVIYSGTFVILRLEKRRPRSALSVPTDRLELNARR